MGTASSYDLRYATDPIDATNFPAATRAAGAPVPQPAGGTETHEITGLDPDTTYYFAIKARDEWGNAGPIGNVPVTTTLPAPTIATSPGSFSAALLTGQRTTRTLTIDNAGVGTLDWRIPLPEAASASPVGSRTIMSLGKGYPDPRAGEPVASGFGGPDEFGYRFLDSDEPGGPVFVWDDIASRGVPIASLTGDDEISEPILLGFEFPFYGAVFDSVRVSTNGWLSFTAASDAFSNQPLPGSGAPENLIAPFWDDLDFLGAARVAYESDGSRFTVQFTDAPRRVGAGSYTFQVTMRASGEVVFRYLSMTGTTTQATVGIQNGTRTVGLQIAFNTGYAHDDLEVRINRAPLWLAASPKEGRLFGGETREVTLTLDASGLEGGEYIDTVLVQSNDPSRPLVGHPVALNVTDAPAIALDPAALDFGTVFLGYSRVLTLNVRNTGTALLTVSEVASGDPEVQVDLTSFTLGADPARHVHAGEHGGPGYHPRRDQRRHQRTGPHAAARRVGGPAAADPGEPGLLQRNPAQRRDRHPGPEDLQRRSERSERRPHGGAHPVLISRDRLRRDHFR
jgi:hypothetical protein